MNLEQLTAIAKDLQAFVNDELAKVSTIQGWNLESFKIGSAIIHEVVERIDAVKAQFSDITNEQMQQLAVDAVYALLETMLKSRLGAVGKLVYTLLPNKLKRKICELVVDLIVNAIHKTKDKVLGSLKK